ncbi:MAG TPA: hypothetical protein VMK31_05555 [Sphingomicrobium sp.]|nr:hypothetical protein [Sphingomicrobium sp.]
MTNIRSIAIALALLLVPAVAAAIAPPTPLFASEEPVSLTLSGPIPAVSRGERGARDAVLTLRSPAAETHAVRLSPRGLTRLKRDVCQFAPMRVEFVQPPPPGSLFEGQRRLKLVTHCRSAESFQQHVLLEYAAYKLYNQLTPASYRARLANIDYVDENGRPVVSRLGFFIEDIDDVAARNGMGKPSVGQRIATGRLSAADAARVALFQYMIGNLDWSTRAGPPGDRCCHNARLIGASSGPLIPVPYDFDFSGLVSAPYAVPPDIIPVRNVRVRHYGGYCLHNPAVPTVAAQFAARRSHLLGTFSQIPHLDERTRARAAAYIDDFFADIADPRTIERKLLRTCIE